jgi:hypothetical protein
MLGPVVITSGIGIYYLVYTWYMDTIGIYCPTVNMILGAFELFPVMACSGHV